MASDFSSGCTEAVDVLDEKEEGEISLEDVSSSEEGHLNYGCNSRRIEQCPGCSSAQHCASWCTIDARTNRSRAFHKKDAVQGKENRLHSKDTEQLEGRHVSSTLQEKNDDLIPISSDSDMELVGLTESTVRVKSIKVKKKKKKRRPRASSLQIDQVPPNTHEVLDNMAIIRHNPAASKENRSLKAHHRAKSPVSKIESHPRRHRSPPVGIRPLAKKTRSPAAHTKSAATRKSPRRLKSPRRSPHKTLVNPLHKKVHKHSSPSKLISSPTNDVRFKKLLKKVRQLDMVGTRENDKVSNKTKEHGSSLKEKLSNILKSTPETNENVTSQAKEDSTDKKTKEKGEEEDDINTLRQKALETKQSKTNKSQESLNAESDIKGSSNNDDDDDEDLQLRLIALRSAVYKKHHNRVQRREKSSKKKSPVPRTESPFSDSFINNVIDVEDDGSLSISPRTSPAMKDCMSLEDMELDSDLERGPDLDDAPYSPTDEVNSELILEAEQLGLDATDVSLININSQVRFSSPVANAERESTPSTPSLGNLFCSSNYSTTTLNSDSLYLTSQSTVSSDSPTKDPHSIVSSGERPYSPSDAPVYDPDLSYSLLSQNVLNSNLTENHKYVNNLGVNNLHSNLLRPVEPLKIDKLNLPTDLISHSVNSMMPSGMITMDDFPDTDLDGSPLVPMEQDSGSDYHIPEHLSYQMLQPSYQPLYLRNSSNLLNGVNQMPTLISKPFVPAPVSRLNNLHQEPKKPSLSIRIQETQEPVFQHVSDLEASNSAVRCKPISLTSLPKKQVILNPGVFDQFRGGSMPDITENKIVNRVEENQNNKVSVNIPEEESPGSKRKRKKVRKKRRSSRKNPSDPEEMTNSVDQGISAKRLKSVETERIVQPSSVDVVNKSKDSKVEKNLDNLKINIERNSEHPKKRQYDPYNNNITIIDGQLSLSKSSINDTSTDSKASEGPRRRSIDEDEEALRASLLASLANRAKATENVVSKPVKAVPKVAATKPSNATSNKLAQNIQVRQTNSLPAAPKKNINLSASVASTAKQIAKVPVNISETAISILGKRRSSLVQVTSPKKIAKKTVIPASIKVVNNAKRYQNSLMQKRLNLQKANTFNARKSIANRSLRVLNRNQNTRSISPNVSAFKNGERFIINLQSDSDSESDAGGKDSSVAVASKSSVEKSHPLTIPRTEFEKSVEQFLRDVRKKQESAAATKPNNITLVKNKGPPAETLPKKGKVTLPATPLAVRHLPASQQEEYHRLKQQILEREKLKLQRTSGSQHSSDFNTVTPPGPLSPAGPTASSKQKSVSAVVINNLPKALSNPKSSPITNLQSSSSSSSLLASQKPNLSIRIRNDGVSPTRISALPTSRNSSNSQKSTQASVHGSVQGNSRNMPKNTMPKLTSSPASSSSSSTLVSQKPNLSIRIRIDGVSPTRISTLPAAGNSPSTQNSTQGNDRGSIQGNCQDLPKNTVPKLTSLPAPSSSSSTLAGNSPSTQNSTQGNDRGSIQVNSQDLPKNTMPKNTMPKLTSLPAPSSSSSTLVSQKPNLSIRVRNDRVSPTRISTLPTTKDSPNRKKSTEENVQGTVQSNSQDLPKNTMPKLRILTCEQVNMKFLQLQVKQKDGRKVIVGDINLPPENISAAKRSELVNNNTNKKLTVRLGNKTDSEASSVSIPESKAVDKTYDSETSTVVLSSSDVTVIREGRVDGTIDSEASTLVLSQCNTTPNSDNNSTSSSTTRINIANQKSPVDLRKATTTMDISEETPERRSIPPSATSTVLKAPVAKKAAITKAATLTKEATVAKAPTVTKEASVAKAPTVTKEATVVKEATVLKATTVGKAATVPKEPIVTNEVTVSQVSSFAKAPAVPKEPPVQKEPSITKAQIISKEPTVTKLPTVTKEPTFTKAPTVLQKPTVSNPPTERTTFNYTATSSTIISKSTTAAGTEKVMPSISGENIKEKSVTLTSSKTTLYEDSSISKSIERSDKQQSVSSTSEGNLQGKTFTQKASKADKEKGNEVWDEIKDGVTSEVNKLLKLDKEEQRRKLVEVEQELVAKRYVVLDDLAAVSGSLRQWEIEKDLQENLALEVRKLREELRVSEERLKEQKERAASMGTRVASFHEKMNFGRKECYRIAKICSGLGIKIVGRKYKIPEAGVQLVNKRLKEVAQHTSQLCKKKEIKSKISESSEKSDKIESEVTSDDRLKRIERHNSCESFASSELYSNSASSEMVNSPDVESNREDSSQKENEPSETQVSCSSEIVSQTIVDESPMDSCEKADNSEKSENADSCSVEKENSKSVICHTTETTQNQSTKSDKQSSKQAGRPYESILTHMRTPRSSQLDGILCPYQLMGSCHDGDCQFIHHPSH